METHKVDTLSLTVWAVFALTVNFISKFWRSSKFWDTFLLIFLQFLKPWVYLPSLFISFNTFFFTSILLSSVCPWSVCILIPQSILVCFGPSHVFITNMVAKFFLSRQRDWLVPRSLRMKSSNKLYFHCGPLKKQNLRTIRIKTDAKSRKKRRPIILRLFENVNIKHYE